MSVRAIVYDQEFEKALIHELRRATEFRFALALVTPAGLERVMPEIRSALGRSAAAEINVGTDLPTHPDALQTLIQLAKEFPDQLQIRRFHSPKRRIFHPKLYLFRSSPGRSRALIGSVNMTDGGLAWNYEASVLLEDRASVNALLVLFEEYFRGSQARKISPEWLAQYRRIWLARKRVERQLRRLREKVGQIRQPLRAKVLPRHLTGYRFVFTGRIEGWPRQRVLYPAVKRAGGTIGLTGASVKNSDFLVHGEILGGHESTVKLRAAWANEIDILTEEEFLRALKRGRKRP